MNLLFYDDSPVFGGHEVMALAGLEAVLASSRDSVLFLTSEANGKLLSRLQELAQRHPHLKIETVAWHSTKLEAARNLLQPSRHHRLAERFRQLAPDLVVAIQGNIEHSSLALHAARRAGIRCLSYIPVPHTNREMGAKLGTVRDLFCGHLFQLPDAFITITDEMARKLRQRGATCAVKIVYNGIDVERFHPGDQTEARKLLGLPAGKILLGVVGRIEFRQKQQHKLVEAVASDPGLAAACHLVFAGDGPDSGILHELLEKHNILGTILTWCDPAPLYRSLDALVIPSRYEGLPLVMLEALATGTSVFGSDRDGMKDLLPADRRFNPDQHSSIASSLSAWLRDGRPAPPEQLVMHIRKTMSSEAFGEAFQRAITQAAAGDFKLH
ncbi:MAG: glycosyltransferase [Akkermansiaceae bacterium]|jgi:glycosyltransferase involved in cell wall biosynthesis